MKTVQGKVLDVSFYIERPYSDSTLRWQAENTRFQAFFSEAPPPAKQSQNAIPADAE